MAIGSRGFRGICALALLTTLTPAPGSAGDIEKGKALYNQSCVTCHGAAGLGDGPVGAALPPEQKPANLVSGTFKYVKDQATFKELLQKGGAGVGLNPLMPPQPAITGSDLDDLYAFVNSLRKK